MRTIARETLFKIIYSSQFSDGIDGELKTALYKSNELTADDISYCESVLKVICERKEELIALLDKHSVSFPEKRIFPSDRSILLIGLAEILYFDDIPDKVSLNEAANIASKYSSAKSATFITGILSSVAGGKNV
ncbi:MAG: transcription antitermination factor NusB [Clostridia bacterium]|nr:transcription antitermination factor NusB [Clostridia bacterium]MDE6791406.1 transcription antitermination factor NusB [Clostridia bacterium]